MWLTFSEHQSEAPCQGVLIFGDGDPIAWWRWRLPGSSSLSASWWGICGVIFSDCERSVSQQSFRLLVSASIHESRSHRLFMTGEVWFPTFRLEGRSSESELARPPVPALPAGPRDRSPRRVASGLCLSWATPPLPSLKSACWRLSYRWCVYSFHQLLSWVEFPWDRDSFFIYFFLSKCGWFTMLVSLFIIHIHTFFIFSDSFPLYLVTGNWI